MVVLLPDNGSRYLSKVFDDNWMRENQFLESDWTDTSVGAVLDRKGSHELIVAHCTDSVGETVAKLKATDVSQLPVVGKRNQLLGVVTEVSLLNYLLMHSGDGTKTKLEDAQNVIDSNVPTINAGTPVETVMSMFSTHKLALVTEDLPDGEAEDKQVVGIVTQIDILDLIANH